MKKIFFVLLAVMLAMFFTACGSTSAPAESAVSDFSAGGETPEEEEPAEAVSGEYGFLVTGTVVYYDGAMLAVCSLDDTNLNFLVAGDEVDKSEIRGLAVGSETDIYYTGAVNGSDTSAAQVTKLVQSRKQAAVRTDLSVTGGVILSADASALRITSYDGAELIFSLATENIDMTNAGGLVAGGYVTVFYEGELKGDAEAVKVVKIVE